MKGESLRTRVAFLRRLIRKELNEILRDRRTIVTLVLMPLLLYPLLGVAFQTFFIGAMSSAGVPVYRIGIPEGQDAAAVESYLRMGEEALAQRETNEERTARSKEIPSPPHERATPELRFVSMEDIDSALTYGLIDAGIRLRPPNGFEDRLRRDQPVECGLLYREDSSVGLEAVHYLERLCTAANTRLLAARLYRRVSPRRETPVRSRPIALANPTSRKRTLLPGLVPLILILMTITGAVYPAIDLTAGERERGTLEILAAAPVSRLHVLFAKYVAVFTVAMLTALVNLATMTVTLYLTGVGEALFGAESLSLRVLAEVLALLLLFAAFFSAVLLTLTSFARSFKEAQAYLVPLMLLALMPGVLSLVPGLKLQGPLAIAPLINIALLTRDLLEGSADPVSAAVVVAATLLYSLAALAAAARIFGAEAVLYSQSGGWSDLFRRAPEQATSVTPAAALVCLALVFPSSFVVNGLLARLGEQSLVQGLLGAALANVLLFGVYPLLSMTWSRVRVSSALRLRQPSPTACLGAVLLGLSLWPWVHEISLILRNAGVATLRPEQLERVEGSLEQWRQLSPFFLVLVLAVMPAVLEEVFFRGYLLSALEGSLRPGQAILASAVLFAVFHVFLGSMLAVERFVPSLLLGLVLGWICYRTGGIWPGMLLHALHNGSLVLLGYYQPHLADIGGATSGQEHLPLAWLAAAALGSIGGGLLIRLGRSRLPESDA